MRPILEHVWQRRIQLPGGLAAAAIVAAAFLLASGITSAGESREALGPSAQHIVPTGRTSTLGESRGHLTLDGLPYRGVGLNAYEIGTEWGTNAGCGTMLTDAELNAFFAALPVHTLVRFWAWQGTMAVNIHTRQLDWGPLDRVFHAAADHSDLLIVSLTSADGSCDDMRWRDPGWYEGGYTQPDAPTAFGLHPISYWSYLKQIVARYANSPALGMWEPINEPEASTCPTDLAAEACSGHQSCPSESVAARSLRQFYDTVGAEIHRLDPRHLVEAGFLGSGQCGTSGTDFEYVGASPGIDVLSYHDYYPPTATVGGDRWNGIAVRARQAAALNKPLIAGEMGILGGSGPSCAALPERAADLDARITAQAQLGVAVFLLWNWVPTREAPCGYDILADDPSLALLGRF